jgi:hypothetical protein
VIAFATVSLVTTRIALRAGIVFALTGPSVLAASPAFAVIHDDGEQPGDSLAPLMTLLWFLVLPIGLFLLIALLVSLPSIMGGPRYRPGLGWRATPEWYGGPEPGQESDAAGAAATGRAGAGAGGAADAPTGAQGEPSGESSDGGASARW